MILDTRPQLFIVFAWLTLGGFTLFLRPLLPVDETRYLAVAWEMWQRGDFLVPYLNGEPYSHKPPLLFWVMHAGWGVFGVSDWWPRLVAPLFGLATMLMTVRLGRILWPGRLETGDAAALIVLGALFWALFITMTMFDMLLACFTVMGMIGLIRAARGRPLYGLGMFAVAIGLGVLAKGPAILVHLLPAALAAPLWASRLAVGSGPAAPSHSWGRWYMRVGAGILLGATIGLAWALPAAEAGGEAYRNAILWGQSAGRMVDSFAHDQPFWWFAAILPAMILPWAIWPAAWRAMRRQGAGLFGDGGTRLVLIWFVAAFLAFSAMSGKQPHYLVPEFPALALLLAAALTNSVSDAEFWRPADRWVPAGLILILVAVLAVGFHFNLKPSWATSVGDAHLWPLTFPFVAVVVFFRCPGDGVLRRVGAVTALSVILICTALGTLRPLVLESHDFRAFSRELKAYEVRGYDFVTFGKYHGQFHFLGRLTRPIAVVDGPNALDAWLTNHSKALIVALHDGLPDGPPPVAETRFRSRIIGAWAADRYPPRTERLKAR